MCSMLVWILSFNANRTSLLSIVAPFSNKYFGKLLNKLILSCKDIKFNYIKTYLFNLIYFYYIILTNLTT